MARDVDIRLLRTFVSVHDHGSMTAAGNALHATQSAVSQRIARLEGLLGPLFVRRTRGMGLTPAGERLLAKARRLIALNDELWAEMTRESHNELVRLGAPQDLVATWLPSILKGFADLHPSAEIALVCMASPELLDAVSRGSIDLALVEQPSASTTGDTLMIDRLVWVGARGGSAHRRTPLPVSLVSETCAFRQSVVDALDAQGCEWRTLYDSGSVDATSATVRADLAITAWLASTMPVDLEVIAIDSGLPTLPQFAITLQRAKGGTNRTAVELGDHLRAEIGPGRHLARLSRMSGLVRRRAGGRLA